MTSQSVTSEHSSEISGIPNPFVFGSILGQLISLRESCLNNVYFLSYNIDINIKLRSVQNGEILLVYRNKKIGNKTSCFILQMYTDLFFCKLIILK